MTQARTTSEAAWAIVVEFTSSKQLIRHMRSVEAAMRASAKRLGEDPERWGVVGILHDFDYESDPSRHPQRGMGILRERGVEEEIVLDIASHAELGVPRDTPLRRTLHAVDELCGFIIACALVKPDRSLGAVGAATVRRKMKDRAFARGVHRSELLEGAQELGVPFEEHVEFVRDALLPIAPELGLEP
ncbi:MAG: HDIG domain-containing metalloprotein [Candidatus Dormibacterales bacterium]